MARKDYKKDEPIRVLYRASAGVTSVNMDVYDETDTLDATQSGVMTQVGTTNRWIATFTPDADGNWSVNFVETGGSGDLIRDYSVGNYNIDSVGAGISTNEAKIDALAVSVAAIVSPPMIG